MSWGIESQVKKAVKKITDPIKKEFYKIRDDAKHSVSWVKDQAKKEVYKVKDDCKRWVKDAGETVKKEVVDEIKEAGQTVQHEFDSIKGDIEDKANEVKNLAEDAKDEIEKLPETVKEETLKTLEEAKKLAENIYGKASKEAFKAGISLAHAITSFVSDEMKEFEKGEPGIVEELNQIGGGFSICGVKFSYSNFYERSKVLSGILSTYTKEPPEFRRKPFLSFIESIGPETVDVGLEASASFVVFQTQNLSISGWIDGIRLKLFLLLGDKLLKKLGVPE